MCMIRSLALLTDIRKFLLLGKCNKPPSHLTHPLHSQSSTIVESCFSRKDEKPFSLVLLPWLSVKMYLTDAKSCGNYFVPESFYVVQVRKGQEHPSNMNVSRTRINIIACNVKFLRDVLHLVTLCLSLHKKRSFTLRNSSVNASYYSVKFILQ